MKLIPFSSSHPVILEDVGQIRVKVPHQTVCHISFIQHWLKFWQTSHYSMWIITASLQHDSRSRTCNVSVVILKHCWRALAVASLVLSNDQANPGLSLSSRPPATLSALWLNVAATELYHAFDEHNILSKAFLFFWLYILQASRTCTYGWEISFDTRHQPPWDVNEA